MAEGSKIDWAAHENEPVAAITDTLAFDEAVGVALEFARNRTDTMLLIATDHGCSGFTLGDRITGGADYTTWTYSFELIDTFMHNITGARLTGEGMLPRLNANHSNVAELVARYWGITDLTQAEIDAVVNAQTDSRTITKLGNIMSSRAHIAWTTYGHTGNDGTLWSFLPGNTRITGTMTNADFALISARAWGICLDELTSELFNEAGRTFELRAYTVEIDDSVRSGALMRVSDLNNVLETPQNKDYVYLNGERIYFDGQVMVFNNGTFFVPQGVLELLPPRASVGIR